MARPRSATAHNAVLEAALSLFADRGIDATSVDAIADTSGVSKATIYKHWRDKEALCIEALARALGREAPPPEFDSGDLGADLVAVLSHQPPEEHADLRTRLMPHLLAYSARNPAFGQAWRTRVLEPPRVQLQHVLARAIARRQLPDTLQMDLAILLLMGPIMYAHMLTLMKRTPPPGLPRLVVDTFLKCYGLPEARKSRQARAKTRKSSR